MIRRCCLLATRFHAETADYAQRRADLFEKVQRDGIPTVRETNYVAPDGTIYRVQPRLQPVDPHDPAFREVQERARIIDEELRRGYDWINPANWGMDADGNFYLLDP